MASESLADAGLVALDNAFAEEFSMAAWFVGRPIDPGRAWLLLTRALGSIAIHERRETSLDGDLTGDNRERGLKLRSGRETPRVATGTGGGPILGA